jgi:prepilin-type N-terminal cleavage/methylation domain-containing protein
MIKRIQALRGKDDGFTLIELLIVVVILGVLSGIVVFAVGAFNNDGVVAACKTDVKSVEVASEAYYAKTGGYATNIDALVLAKYLKEAPNSTKYTVNYDNTTGAASSTTCPPVTP